MSGTGNAESWRRPNGSDWRRASHGSASGGAFIGQPQSTSSHNSFLNNSNNNNRRPPARSWRQSCPTTASDATSATAFPGPGASQPSGSESGNNFFDPNGFQPSSRTIRSSAGSGHPNTPQTWAKARNRGVHRNFISPPRISSRSSAGHGNRTGSRNDSGTEQDDPETTAAIAEGRRIYVGNLLYSAKPEDIERLLANCDLSYERIHISIDPFTGRNPSYCFVEFPAKTLADSAMATLSGQELLGREVKCGPCVPKTRADRGETFKRWGDWKGPSPLSSSSAPVDLLVESNPPGSRDVEIMEDGGARLVVSPQANISSSSSPGGPYEALKHWEGMADAKRRLYVGGLPRMADQRTCDHQVRELFQDFHVEAVSKAISPHNRENREGGSKGHANSYYCFVDFPSAEEAARAADNINGRRIWGGRLRVAHAKGDSRKWREREKFDGWDGEKAIRIGQGIGDEV